MFFEYGRRHSVEDPAIDLAICVSVVSSLEEIAISDKACFAAEVGLGGELRAVNRIEQRISEAENSVHRNLYQQVQSKVHGHPGKITIKSFGKLTEVFEDLFG